MVDGKVRALVDSRDTANISVVGRRLGGLLAAGLLLLSVVSACQPAGGKKANAPASGKSALHKADLAALGEGINKTAPAQDGPALPDPVLSSSAAKWLESKGLYDLAKVTLPKGTQEVRLWDDIGVINGTIVQKRGSTYYGVQVFLPEDCQPGACAGWVVALTPCVPWDKLWSSLEEQGVLDHSGSTGQAPLDGADEKYTVEVQSDGKYWATQYIPASDDGPAAQKVKALDGVTNRSLYCH